MSRTLTSKQKKILSAWAESVDYEYSFGTPAGDLPYHLYQEVRDLNDHETIIQNINRFLNDLSFRPL